MNLKEGDRVKIKTWEALLKEFGLYASAAGGIDYIKTDPCFTDSMEEQLPKDRIVTLGYFGDGGPGFECADLGGCYVAPEAVERIEEGKIQ